VENRFHHNTQLTIKSAPKKVSLFLHKAYSDSALIKLLSSDKKNYFDLIYVDGSHQASDVLFDAVVSFKLLRVDGIMVFDDYLWAEELPARPAFIDPLRCPKPAIDSFINLNIRKLRVLHAPLGQLYIQKVSD
jgi:predicted O-methyltransferase YrrM